MTDIVEHLRDEAVKVMIERTGNTGISSKDVTGSVIWKAADEIERLRALTSPQLHQHGGGVERPMHSPLRQSETDPAWMQVIKLFQRHGAPEPPVRLRDEIVVALDWAWYGYALAQQPLSVPDQLKRIAAEIQALKLHPATGEEYDAGYIAARNDAFAIVQEAIDNAQ